MRPTARSMMCVGVVTLGLGLSLGTSPARAQGLRPGESTASQSWSTYAVSRPTTSSAASSSTNVQPSVVVASGWAGYAPGTAWSGYVPGTAWVRYSPRVGRVSSTVSHYRELGSGRPIPLAKPWLPGSP